jgi:hypothetical protein
LDSEWVLAAVIIAVPVALVGIVEILAYRRRRRDKRIARRPKGPPRASSGRRRHAG